MKGNMTSLHRHRTIFNGFMGQPGVATMYFLDTTTAIASLHTLWTAWAMALPSDVTIELEPGGDTIEDTNGHLTGSWAGDPSDIIPGERTDVYAAPVGVAVDWHSGTILDGHRVRGRTFVVPSPSTCFGTDGQVVTATSNALKTAADEFIIEQSSSFVIWHRPFAGRPAAPPKPEKPAHDGGHALVLSSTVSRKPAVLRSRRD